MHRSEEARADGESRASERAQGALQVGGGVLASRLAGLLRDRALAHFFGLGAHADVFAAALRVPNLVQNLLGEQALSASFIPVYSRFLRDGRGGDASRLAGAVLGLLALAAAGLALLGWLGAEPLVALLAPGFLGDAADVAAGLREIDRFALTVTALRWTFPMTGLLVLAAWALGVLNSHRRFFLPYAAPIVWSGSIVAALAWAAARSAGPNELVVAACVGALAGGVLQFLVQLPAVVRELRGLPIGFSLAAPGVRETLRAFGPAVVGRGVVQLSSFLDLLLASLLAPGAISGLRNGQLFYLLPISLFGFSLAAAQLPALAQEGDEEARFAARLRANLSRVTFLALPSAAAYLCFGALLVGAVLQTGGFGAAETHLVGWILAAYALGLPAAAAARLLQSGYYARGETARPARIAAMRVALGTAVALPAMFALDRLSVPGAGASLLRLGGVGLGLAASAGAWWEFAALLRGLRRRHPTFTFPWREAGRTALFAAAAGITTAAAVAALPAAWPLLARAAVASALFGGVFLGLSAWSGAEEQAGVKNRVGRKRVSKAEERR